MIKKAGHDFMDTYGNRIIVGYRFTCELCGQEITSCKLFPLKTIELDHYFNYHNNIISRSIIRLLKIKENLK